MALKNTSAIARGYIPYPNRAVLGRCCNHGPIWREHGRSDPIGWRRRGRMPKMSHNYYSATWLVVVLLQLQRSPRLHPRQLQSDLPCVSSRPLMIFASAGTWSRYIFRTRDDMGAQVIADSYI